MIHQGLMPSSGKEEVLTVMVKNISYSMIKLQLGHKNIIYFSNIY